MGLFTEDQYDEMDEDEREEWDYRQRIEDQREHELTLARANKNRGTDMGAILRQKEEDRRAAATVALEERMAKGEVIVVDEPKVETPTEVPIVEAEVIEEVPIVEVAKTAKGKSNKSKDGLFIKAGIGALQSDLFKELDGASFKTLMLLSTYMDNKGECFPGEDTLAEILGIRRETVSRQISKLLKYRTPDGSPILEVRKIKVAGKPYARSYYKVFPASGLSFGK